MIKKKFALILVGLGILIFLIKIMIFYHFFFFDFTPIGYRFELLKDTPVWKLAKAVKVEDTDEIRRLIHDEHMNVNYQERNSEWGTTLLHLAVGNGKVKSVKALLENGARQDIRDSLGDYPLNELCDMTIYIRHRLEILKLLLDHGANPNATQEVYFQRRDTTRTFISTPLNGAIKDLNCTKLLLDYGADMNYQVNRSNDVFQLKYINWVALLELEDDPDSESIFVAKYLIVDKQMPIPEPLRYGTCETGHCPFSALYFLNKVVYHSSSKNKAKEEILAYLKKEGFPQHGVIKDGKVIK